MDSNVFYLDTNNPHSFVFARGNTSARQIPFLSWKRQVEKSERRDLRKDEKSRELDDDDVDTTLTARVLLGYHVRISGGWDMRVMPCYFSLSYTVLSP